MIPIALNPNSLTIGLAGRGPALHRRLALLRSGGAQRLLVFSDDPNLPPQPPDLAVAPLPRQNDIASLDLLWLAGLSADESAELAAIARSHRVLVNVEDQPALCDFHSVAELRRGDLLITVSTGGRSPGLAARIRARLARQFGPEWASRITEIAAQRQDWRHDGASMAEVTALTDALVKSAGWLA
jgi:precorrin-2 dehydrogenase / sirohydrochlorin ferrochelatase